MNEKRKLFPFDPAKAQTITNPDGFPVWSGGNRAREVAIFSSGTTAVISSDGIAFLYSAYEAKQYLRLGPKLRKTVYLNCWENKESGNKRWVQHGSESEAKAVEQANAIANSRENCVYIAIPVAGPEIEP